MGFEGFDLIFKNKTPDYAGIANSQEQQRQQAIQFGTNEVNKRFAGFDDAFYNQRAKDYMAFSLPQLARQYQTNRNQVSFNLANRGLRNSTAANRQYGDLDIANAQAAQGIVDSGIGQAQQLQRQVEQQRNSLLGMVNQSVDPAGAAGGATRAAAGFTPPSTFGPLANQFQNFANTYYLSQLINTYRPGQTMTSTMGPTYNGNASALPGAVESTTFTGQ